MSEIPTISEIRQLELKRIKICYFRHEVDKNLFDSFYNHLSVLRPRKILDWILDVPGGEAYQNYVKHQFEKTQIIILFLSISFHNKYGSKETINLLKEC